MKDVNEEETENESEAMTTDVVSNDGGAVDETVQAAVLAAAEAAGNAVPDSGSVDDGAGEDSSAHQPPTKRRRTGTRKGSRPWNDMMFELMKFRQVHGNLMVPFKSGGDLGKWVASQRAQYLSLQKQLMGDNTRKWQSQDGAERLTEERMKVLSSLGFVWDVVQADNDARWRKRFEELKEYKAMHGHCNVPQSTDLGKWVKMQRENKHESDLKKLGVTPNRKKPKPCLSDDRIEKLEELGFQWRIAKPAVGWEARYDQLIAYRNQHGDCNVPQSYPPDKPFGRWVMKQRCQHSLKLRGEKSQLTDEREKKLNGINFSWVAPGFSKKTVQMPGDEEETRALEQQAVEHLHATAQESVLASELGNEAAQEYATATWNV